MYDFNLSKLNSHVAEVIDGKLVLGGSVLKGKRAALAQVDLVTNKLDFSRIFQKAHVITAVAEAPEISEASIVVLATQDMNYEKSKAYLLELSSTGQIVGKVAKVPLR